MNEIIKTSVDNSKWQTTINKPWRIGAEAAPNLEYSLLTPSSEKILRASVLPADFSTVIGGLCSVFTGDLSRDLDPRAAKLIRMDQVAEAVGAVDNKSAFIIIEDSFFSILTRTDQTIFTQQGLKAAKGIEKWLQLTSQITNLSIAFTSNPQLDKGLKELVQQVANDDLRNPNFAQIQTAPVLMMYTGYWPKLLASLNIIPDDKVVCVEPIIHFIDDRILPNRELNSAYQDFLSWLQENPYAQPNSVNANMGIAGFWESRTPINQTRTRLLPFDQVPNTENYLAWCQQIIQTESSFPFPLKNNLIFMEAINWGMYQPETREILAQLVTLENNYYQERQTTPKQQRNQIWAANLRADFQQRSTQLIKYLSGQTQSIITQVLNSI